VDDSTVDSDSSEDTTDNGQRPSSGCTGKALTWSRMQLQGSPTPWLEDGGFRSIKKPRKVSVLSPPSPVVELLFTSSELEEGDQSNADPVELNANQEDQLSSNSSASSECSTPSKCSIYQFDDEDTLFADNTDFDGDMCISPFHGTDVPEDIHEDIEVADVEDLQEVDPVQDPLLELPLDLVEDQILEEAHEPSTIMKLVNCSNTDVVNDIVVVNSKDPAVSYPALSKLTQLKDVSFFCNESLKGCIFLS
jgi:hypothetical protein